MAAADQSPPGLPPEPALLALARQKFGALSRAEEEVFRAAQQGTIAFIWGNVEDDDPANAANWSADRVVRRGCISWLCTDPQASALVANHGLELFGMRIDHWLTLDNAEIKFPLRAQKCAFSHILLRDAQLEWFELAGCQISSLDASRATINGSLVLGKGFKAVEQVNLAGIRIAGDLDCDGAQLSHPRGFALLANGAKIGGTVFFREGFEAEGEVNLSGARIGRDLDCTGAHFSKVEGSALNAGGAKIAGSVFLRNSFKAAGKVDFARATIGADLECWDAQFLNAEGVALDASGARIDGAVAFYKVSAQGGVDLTRARVGEDLECTDAQFSATTGSALTAELANIKGNVFLRGGLTAKGEVSLVATTIGGSLQIREIGENHQMILDLRLAAVETFWDDEDSWPGSGNLFLDGFRYERLYEEAPFEADKRKRWLSLQPPDRFRPQPYEQLSTVLRQMGHNDEARLVMIAKNHERARFTDFPHQGWWWHNVFGRLIDYGYAPWRAFAMSVAMILLGTILFASGSAYDLISPTSENAYAKAPDGQVILEENGRQKISETYPVFNAFVYSLESFVPLLKLDQSANWRPNANRRSEVSILHRRVPYSGGFLRGYLYFHIATGWLLTSLWVGAITGLVKT